MTIAGALILMGRAWNLRASALLGDVSVGADKGERTVTPGRLSLRLRSPPWGRPLAGAVGPDTGHPGQQAAVQGAAGPGPARCCRKPLTSRYWRCPSGSSDDPLELQLQKPTSSGTRRGVGFYLRKVAELVLSIPPDQTSRDCAPPAHAESAAVLAALANLSSNKLDHTVLLVDR
jgi:hypothetical protein